jgi:hypothetical protein
MDDAITPRKAATKSPLDLWRSVDSHAMNLRGRLGFDPVNFARLAKDMGLAHKASEDALAKLADEGEAIRKRRAPAYVVQPGEER